MQFQSAGEGFVVVLPRAIDVFFLLQPETIAKNVTNCESFKQIIPPVVQLHTLQCAEQN